MDVGVTWVGLMMLFWLPEKKKKNSPLVKLDSQTNLFHLFYCKINCRIFFLVLIFLFCAFVGELCWMMYRPNSFYMHRQAHVGEIQRISSSEPKGSLLPEGLFRFFSSSPLFFTGFLLFLRPGSEKKSFHLCCIYSFHHSGYFHGISSGWRWKQTECNREKLVFMLE